MVDGKKRKDEGGSLIQELLIIRTPEWYNAMEIKDAIIEKALSERRELNVWGPDFNDKRGVWEVIVFNMEEVG